MLVKAFCFAVLAFSQLGEAAKLTKHNVNGLSKKVKPGNYYIQNAQTKAYLTYEPDHANSWYPQKRRNANSITQIKLHHNHAVLSPGKKSNRNKCASAQWTDRGKHRDTDWALALYDCAVVGFNGKKAQAFQGNTRDGEVRHEKQFQWVVPAGSGKYKIVAVDHSQDQPLRCMTGASRVATYNHKLKMVGLDKCNSKDAKQLWRLIKA